MQRAEKENLERNTAASHQLLNLLLLLNYRRLVVTNSQTEENVKLFNIWHNLHRIHKFPQSRSHNRQIHVTSVIFFNRMSLCSVNKLFSAKRCTGPENSPLWCHKEHRWNSKVMTSHLLGKLKLRWDIKTDVHSRGLLPQPQREDMKKLGVVSSSLFSSSLLFAADIWTLSPEVQTTARGRMCAGTERAWASMEVWRTARVHVQVSRHFEKHLYLCVDIHDAKTVKDAVDFQPMHTKQTNKYKK